MAAMTALAIGSAVASVAGGVAAYQQGKAQQDVSKQQAKIAIAKGKIESFQQAQEVESIRKRATAQAGKGGGSLSGSALEVLNTSMTNAQLDAEMIDFNAQVQADNYIQEGRNARAAGTASLISSVGNAMGTASTLKGN